MKFITTILLLGLVVVGGYLFVTKNAPVDVPKTANTGEQNITESLETKNEERKMAFADFIRNDRGSYECTVNQNLNGAISQGHVFISDGKISGTFSSSVNGSNVDTNIIVKDGFSYVWSSLLVDTGFKSPVLEGEGDISTKTSGNYSWNNNNIGDYECNPWTLENSKFDLPSGINFSMI